MSTVVVFHKTPSRGLCLINQNAKRKPRDKRNAVLYTRTHPKRTEAGHKSFTVVGHA